LDLNLAWRIDWLFSILFRTKRKISKHSAISLQNQDKISNQKVVDYLNYSFEKIDDYLDKITVFFK